MTETGLFQFWSQFYSLLLFHFGSINLMDYQKRLTASAEINPYAFFYR